jgi:pseudouridine synthase
MRLNAFLAKAGVASRRKADEFIKSGKVLVNGKVGQLNDDVSNEDVIKFDNKQVKLRKSRYIILNKPAGYITTLKDPHGRRKVMDLIKIPERVVPVGRLDYDTTGALLLTNDGDLTNRLMHPRFEVKKTYVAEVEGNISDVALNKLSLGVQLDDGQAAPADARKLAGNEIELKIHEGRKHQVKRMLAAVGLTTKKLHRSNYAGLTLNGLKPGQWRDLTDEEVKLLK